jgi:hypothetical protein
MILKCSEADSNYKKIRGLFNKADLNGAEKILTSMETLNITALKDLQNEVSKKIDLLDLVGQLNDQF